MHDRPNLTVRANSPATRILLDGQRACGVAYVHTGAEAIAHADAEVILSAGAINSPQLDDLPKGATGKVQKRDITAPTSERAP